MSDDTTLPVSIAQTSKVIIYMWSCRKWRIRAMATWPWITRGFLVDWLKYFETHWNLAWFLKHPFKPLESPPNTQEITQIHCQQYFEVPVLSAGYCAWSDLAAGQGRTAGKWCRTLWYWFWHSILCQCFPKSLVSDRKMWISRIGRLVKSEDVFFLIRR